MTRYCGVKCATCEGNIPLAIIGAGANQIAFYAIPLDPIPCKGCGASHEYGSVDLDDADGLVAAE